MHYIGEFWLLAGSITAVLLVLGMLARLLWRMFTLRRKPLP